MPPGYPIGRTLEEQAAHRQEGVHEAIIMLALDERKQQDQLLMPGKERLLPGEHDPAPWRFHHLGVATTSLKRDVRAYGLIGYRPEGKEFADERQGVRGQFLAENGAPRLELLEPLPGSETLSPFLAHGVKCYHHAYEVDAIDAAIEALRAAHAKLIRPPTPAVAFQERRIAFLMLPNGWIVELIDSPGV